MPSLKKKKEECFQMLFFYRFLGVEEKYIFHEMIGRYLFVLFLFYFILFLCRFEQKEYLVLKKVIKFIIMTLRLVLFFLFFLKLLLLSGCFGIVYRGSSKSTGKPVAIKMFRKCDYVAVKKEV